MSTHQFLVFFETSGNQSYIYATNKLRENIGASELTYRAATQWVLEAAGFNGVPTTNPGAFREWLIEHGKCENKRGVEVVLCTSGKSLLVVNDEDTAKKIVAAVTKEAALEAPGLSITGAIVKMKGRDKDAVSKAKKEVETRFEQNRDWMPTPQQRFQMLPFCEPCATSGLPASAIGEAKAPYAPPRTCQAQDGGRVVSANPPSIHKRSPVCA